MHCIHRRIYSKNLIVGEGILPLSYINSFLSSTWVDVEKYGHGCVALVLQQLRACICGALAQRGGLDAASESAAQIVASRSGSELLQASDSIQAAIDALAANASAGAVTGYLAMKLR